MDLKPLLQRSGFLYLQRPTEQGTAARPARSRPAPFLLLTDTWSVPWPKPAHVGFKGARDGNGGALFESICGFHLKAAGNGFLMDAPDQCAPCFDNRPVIIFLPSFRIGGVGHQLGLLCALQKWRRSCWISKSVAGTWTFWPPVAEAFLNGEAGNAPESRLLSSLCCRVGFLDGRKMSFYASVHQRACDRTHPQFHAVGDFSKSGVYSLPTTTTTNDR